ncbi:MAG: sigma-70 family RNA polymerase sigma factor [Oscillospiraceae bacterium]|nr:sigma-70 family RNA polymerase sigma factor [Oscillospiraceae bacterium]
MNKLVFSFEQTPWEAFLMTKGMGDRISAAQLLALLEEEDEQAVENALADLETGCMILDISDLPKPGAIGESAVRLRQEMQMAAKGMDPRDLDENDPLCLYLEEISGIAAAGDEAVLAKQAAAGKQSAMEQLTNLGLSRVVSLAAEHVGYGVLLLDLIQEGSLGLWQAVRNYRFGDYAEYRDRWIRFYMAKAVTLQARSGGVGQKMRTALEDYRAVDERLLAELGRNATLEEIAQELHMKPEEAEFVRKMLDDARMMAQVRKPQEEDEEKEEEEDVAVEDTALFQSRQRIADLLSGLDKQDQKLLALRFGLEGGKPLSPEEIGKIMGLTAQEVVAREGAALQKLRNG